MGTHAGPRMIESRADRHQGRPVVSRAGVTIEEILQRLGNRQAIEQLVSQDPRLKPEEVLGAVDYAVAAVNRPRCSWLFLLPGWSLLLAAAHFYRWGQPGISASCLLLAGWMLWRKEWVRPVVQALLLAIAIRWGATLIELAQMRIAMGQPWLRMAAILVAVIAFTLFSAWVMGLARIRAWYGSAENWLPAAAAFTLTALVLGGLQHGLPLPLLLLERYWPGFGWLQVLGMALYAGWMTERFLDPSTARRLRPRLWGLFSLVFFAQLALGLAGMSAMLMTGRLHLPVPALIIAGPIYRGSGLFMSILFVATVLLVGPAWCSHLCYIGAWEDRLGRLSAAPRPLPKWRSQLRWRLLPAVIIAAILLRYLGVGPLAATGVAAAFGAVGVGIMALISTRNGQMSHCVSWCPVGLVGNWLGKLSPFRLRIAAGCHDCLRCRPACRYDALHREDIAQRRPGRSCTLCGDCIASCHSGQITYRFLTLAPQAARALFVTLVISLHAIFLAVARI